MKKLINKIRDYFIWRGHLRKVRKQIYRLENELQDAWDDHLSIGTQESYSIYYDINLELWKLYKHEQFIKKVMKS